MPASSFVRRARSWSTAVLRMIALRLGAALVDRSVLERADDVFLLFLDELALVNDPSDLGTTIARRRTAFARLETAYREGVPWPVAIGAVPSPEEDERVSPDGAVTLTGVPASRGTYVGTARSSPPRQSSGAWPGATCWWL